MKQIISSIGITLAISTGFAFGVKNIFDFWPAFVLITTLQVFGFFVWNTYQLHQNTKQQLIDQKEIEELENLQYATVECPCGNYNSIEQIFISGDNIFDCPSCKSRFKVDVDLVPMLVTDIISAASIYERLQQEAIKNDESIANETEL